MIGANSWMECFGEKMRATTYQEQLILDSARAIQMHNTHKSIEIKAVQAGDTRQILEARRFVYRYFSEICEIDLRIMDEANQIMRRLEATTEPPKPNDP